MRIGTVSVVVKATTGAAQNTNDAVRGIGSYDMARRAIEEHQQLELSVRDSQAFVDALLPRTA